jgi:uncharacterized LabA/DUF88 family protein
MFGGEMTSFNHTVASSETSRVIVYIDGFNAYNGIRAAGLLNCRWLDWSALARSLCAESESVDVRYFTALVNVPLDGRKRQQHYLRALEIHSGVKPIHGGFMARPMECPACEHSWKRPKEQYTDVNIAIAMVDDAIHRRPNRVVLISGDSDLVPAVTYVRNLGIRVTNIIPPRRKSDDLVNACDDHAHVDPLVLRRCSLPNPVVEHYRGGRKQRLHRAPDGWT